MSVDYNSYITHKQMKNASELLAILVKNLSYHILINLMTKPILPGNLSYWCIYPDSCF